jgi:hypothetical protein
MNRITKMKMQCRVCEKQGVAEHVTALFGLEGWYEGPVCSPCLEKIGGHLSVVEAERRATRLWSGMKQEEPRVILVHDRWMVRGVPELVGIAFESEQDARQALESSKEVK